MVIDTGKGTIESGPRPSTLKRINMRRFLEELRVRGPSTRAELTRATGVAPPTSSSIIADLLEGGWLETTENRSPAKGRPGTVFKLAAESAQVLGVLIQIDECVIAPAGLDGMPQRDRCVRFRTPKTYRELLSVIEGHCRSLMQGRCLGVGIGVPGLVDESAGVVALSPNLHCLDGQSLGPDLTGRLGVPVVCTQEEHALCLAEQHLGGAKGLTDFVVLDVSAGMGMGVVSGSRYLSGRSGFAGEIGHVTAQPDGPPCGCGNRGCLETVATDTAFLNAVRSRLNEDIDLEALARLGVTVEPELGRTLDYLAIAVAAITNLFNPEAVFIHGRLLQLWPDTHEKLVAKSRERALRPSFEGVKVYQACGDKLYGSLAGLLDHVFAKVGPRLS